jgi:hypothetical protein
MHMTMEGSLAGWSSGSIYWRPGVARRLKNFRWVAGARDAGGQQRFRWEYVPLADGQAPLPEFAARLTELKFDGVASFHSEYKGDSSFRKLATSELLDQSSQDLRY